MFPFPFGPTHEGIRRQLLRLLRSRRMFRNKHRLLASPSPPAPFAPGPSRLLHIGHTEDQKPILRKTFIAFPSRSRMTYSHAGNPLWPYQRPSANRRMHAMLLFLFFLFFAVVLFFFLCLYMLLFLFDGLVLILLLASYLVLAAAAAAATGELLCGIVERLINLGF